MIKEEVTKFMALAPLMLPRLIGSNGPDETDITDDSAILFLMTVWSFPCSATGLTRTIQGFIIAVSLQALQGQR